MPQMSAPPPSAPPMRPPGRRRLTSGLLLAGGLAGCSMFNPPPNAPLPGDRLSPARVADLHVDGSTRTNDRSLRVCFSWTAPGDDGIVGRATTYQFGYASELEDMLNWSVDGRPPSGSTWQASVEVDALVKEAHCYDLLMPVDRMPFYFAMRTRDDVNNLVSYMGAMAASPSDGGAADMRGGDLETARLFGKRVADVAQSVRG